MIPKLIYYSKLFFGLLCALALSYALANDVFLENTPSIRPKLAQHLGVRASYLISIIQSPFLSPQVAQMREVQRRIQTELAEVAFQQVSKGVHAKEKEDLQYVEVRLNEIEWEDHSLVIKGKTVNVRMPKGVPPPSIEELEKTFQ